MSSKQLGGGKVNPAACTPDDHTRNAQIIAETLNPIIDGNTALPENQWPFVRFELDNGFTSQISADAIVLGADGSPTGDTIELFDVQNRYSGASAGQKGYATIYGSTPAYEVIIIDDGGGTAIDPDDIFSAITISDAPGPISGDSEYDPATNTLYIVGTGGSGLDIKVKISANDSTAGYLYEKHKDGATRIPAEDLLVYADIEDDGPASDENLRLFLKGSTIPGYSANAYQNLVNDNGTMKLAVGSDTIVVKITGTITARSGTTRGSGTAVAVDPTNLANELGGSFTVYNLSQNSYIGNGSGGDMYCLAYSVDGVYFIDPTDLRSIEGFADTKYLGVEGSDVKFRSFETGTIDGTISCDGVTPSLEITPDTFVIPPT